MLLLFFNCYLFLCCVCRSKAQLVLVFYCYFNIPTINKTLWLILSYLIVQFTDLINEIFFPKLSSCGRHLVWFQKKKVRDVSIWCTTIYLPPRYYQVALWWCCFQTEDDRDSFSDKSQTEDDRDSFSDKSPPRMHPQLFIQYCIARINVLVEILQHYCTSCFLKTDHFTEIVIFLKVSFI